MNKNLLFCALLALPISFGIAQARPDKATMRTTQPHKIVFEMSIEGMDKWESVLRNAQNVQNSFGARNTRIEIVAHGKGLGLLLGKTSVENPKIKAMIQSLHENGVVFGACNNTMQRLKLTPKDLLQVATVVDSGVAEVVRKQEAGWTYLKSG